MEYKKRIADGMLRDKLDAMGAILIEGPKACGKTTTAEQIAGSVLYMDDPDKMDTYLQLVDTNIVSSKVDFHQSGIEKGTRERVRSKVTKFGYHYKFLSSF